MPSSRDPYGKSVTDALPPPPFDPPGPPGPPLLDDDATDEHDVVGADGDDADVDNDELWRASAHAKGFRVRLPIALLVIAIVALAGIWGGAKLNARNQTNDFAAAAQQFLAARQGAAGGAGGQGGGGGGQTPGTGNAQRGAGGFGGGGGGGGGFTVG